MAILNNNQDYPTQSLCDGFSEKSPLWGSYIKHLVPVAGAVWGIYGTFRSAAILGEDVIVGRLSGLTASAYFLSPASLSLSPSCVWMKM